MKTVIAGSSGRMGRMLIEAVLASGDLQLHGALDVADSPALGQDAGALLGRPTGVAIRADLDGALRGADVLIDFTRPEGTMAHLAACHRLGVKAVVGTTGFTGSVHGAGDGTQHERGRERGAQVAGRGRPGAERRL